VLDASIARLYAEPDSSLLQGMLFGERRGLPQALQDTLASVGLIHIVILAGYALTLVAGAIGNAAFVLPRRYRLAVVAVLLVVYVAMTGAVAATVRASIMALIAMIARMSGRASAAMRSLAFAIIVMALWNPPMLLWDSGFIVSALATFGLIALGGSIETFFHFIPHKLKLREIATSTVSVQIFALPALLYYTGNLSLISIPANLLALPALPYAMLFGFLSAFLNLIHPALALIPTLMANALVHYILAVAGLMALVPMGFTTVYAFPWWGALGIYAPLTLLALNEYRLHEDRKK
jgi:competence protein ComEC